MKRVSQVLRAAMVEAEKRGVSLYRIAKACQLDDSIVYRFYHDESGLALSSVDQLCQFLKLELVKSETASGTTQHAKRATPLRKSDDASRAARPRTSAKKAVTKLASRKSIKKKASKKKTAAQPAKRAAKKKSQRAASRRT